MAGERKGGDRATGAAALEAERRLEHDDEVDREFTTEERVRALDEASPTGRPEESPEAGSARREEEEAALRRQAGAPGTPGSSRE